METGPASQIFVVLLPYSFYARERCLVTTDLQKYQWTTQGMRRDDSTLGAMWFYRGMDVDGTLGRYDADLNFLKQSSKADNEHMSVLDKEVAYLRAKFERIREALASSDSASLRIEAIYEILTDGE